MKIELKPGLNLSNEIGVVHYEKPIPVQMQGMILSLIHI